MYLLWPKGENKLHFSIFWKPVICSEEIKCSLAHYNIKKVEANTL